MRTSESSDLRSLSTAQALLNFNSPMGWVTGGPPVPRTFRSARTACASVTQDQTSQAGAHSSPASRGCHSRHRSLIMARKKVTAGPWSDLSFHLTPSQLTLLSFFLSAHSLLLSSPPGRTRLHSPALPSFLLLLLRMLSLLLTAAIATADAPAALCPPCHPEDVPFTFGALPPVCVEESGVDGCHRVPSV